MIIIYLLKVIILFFCNYLYNNFILICKALNQHKLQILNLLLLTFLI